MSKGSILKTKDCTVEEFELIKKYIAEFELDDRNLQQKEFVTISDDSGLLGFGRVREYDGFSEMCSLGVLTRERSKGLGKLLSEAMIKKATQTTYLVCIIPSYFEPMGFKICHDFPPEILEKLNYCMDSLHVEEKYVVMRKN